MLPFRAGNYCYRDELGRECLAVLRTFGYSSGTAGLNSVLVDGRDGFVDYLGDGPELLFPLSRRSPELASCFLGAARPDGCGAQTQPRGPLRRR